MKGKKVSVILPYFWPSISVFMVEFLTPEAHGQKQFETASMSN